MPTSWQPSRSLAARARNVNSRTALYLGSARVIATLVVLRFQLPQAALAEPYRVHRATSTRAVGEIRPLLAACGFAVPGKPDLRLHTPADVFAYAAAEGVEIRIDTQRAAYNTVRHAQSSQRICVKHTIAEPKQWRSLQRYTGRREHFEDTMLAIAGLVSGRCAER